MSLIAIDCPNGSTVADYRPERVWFRTPEPREVGDEAVIWTRRRGTVRVRALRANNGDGYLVEIDPKNSSDWVAEWTRPSDMSPRYWREFLSMIGGRRIVRTRRFRGLREVIVRDAKGYDERFLLAPTRSQ